MQDIWTDFESQMRAIIRQIEGLARKMATNEFVFKEPLADMSFKDNKLKIEIDLPGVEKENIQILATENDLEIKAEKRIEKEEKGKSYYKQERQLGTYARKFVLPEKIDPKTIVAKYEDGVLKIEAELKEKKKEEKVKVKVK
ncbi:MAG: Hsp20/alpha crystallin family protein [Candidatus Nanoarchaeia archaeon]